MSTPNAQILQLRKIAQGKDIAMRRWAIVQLISLDPVWLAEQKIAPPVPTEASDSLSSRPVVTSEAVSRVSEAIGAKTVTLLGLVGQTVDILLADGRTGHANRLADAAKDLIAGIESAKLSTVIP